MLDEGDSENTFRILISTDNHLGFAEKDGLRGNDSFRTFEEILNLAISHNVDFILFGGDIFHDNRPSLKSMHEAIRLLRMYCYGNKPVQFEILSDPKVLFANTSSALPNYLDGNINIGTPVFTIHGNHDDLSGPGGLCAADILHAAGLVNLFGKYTSVEQISINPILLRKGTTRLALYGLGAVREERLHRLFLNNALTFYCPTEDDENWFSMCVVHQNRSHHGPTNYLPAHFLPNFLDLIVWGHEHECRVDPEWNSSQNFYIVQPGSSIATSLSEGEARDKAVALLEIKGKEFKVTKLPLKTVRPLIFRDIVLQDEVPKLDPDAKDIAKKIEVLCNQFIEDEINKAVSTSIESLRKVSGIRHLQEDSNSAISPILRLHSPSEPLIRFRIDLSGGYESFSALRFGQEFVGRVANPKDLIIFNKNRENRITRAEKSGLRKDSNLDNFGKHELDNKNVGLDSTEVEQLVRQYLMQMAQAKGRIDELKSTGLDLFTTNELELGLKSYVDRGLSDAILNVSTETLNKTLRYLRMRKVSEERIVTDVLHYCHSRNVRNKNDEYSDGAVLDEQAIETKSNSAEVDGPSKSKVQTTVKLNWSLEEEDEEYDNDADDIVQNTKSKAVRRGGGGSLAKGRNSKRNILDNNSELDDSEEEERQVLESMVEDASDVECDSEKSDNTTMVRGKPRGRGRIISGRKTTNMRSPDLELDSQLNVNTRPKRRRKLV